MTLLRYISHPEVNVDSTVAVPRWTLSTSGRSRVFSDAPTAVDRGHIPDREQR